MEYSHQLSEVIEALGQSYRSIDFRGILVALEDSREWRGLTVIMRLTCDSVVEIAEEHKRLIETLDISNEFRLRKLGDDFEIPDNSLLQRPN